MPRYVVAKGNLYQAILIFNREPAQKEYKALAEHADLIEPKAKDRAEFIEEAKSGALEGIVALYRTFGSASVTGRFDDELLSVLPKSLKFVCHNGRFQFS